MDHERRISRSEAQVEDTRMDINRLYEAIQQLQKRTDEGFADLRKDTRWLAGLVFVIASMVVGIAGKVFGMY